MFNKFAIALWLAASTTAATAAQATPGVQVIHLAPAPARLAAPDALAAPGTQHVVVPVEYTVSSELPEPEVFLMMLVGLLLIGVRAGHISHEKFEQ